MFSRWWPPVWNDSNNYMTNPQKPDLSWPGCQCYYCNKIRQGAGNNHDAVQWCRNQKQVVEKLPIEKSQEEMEKFYAEMLKGGLEGMNNARYRRMKKEEKEKLNNNILKDDRGPKWTMQNTKLPILKHEDILSYINKSQNEMTEEDKCHNCKRAVQINTNIANSFHNKIWNKQTDAESAIEKMTQENQDMGFYDDTNPKDLEGNKKPPLSLVPPSVMIHLAQAFKEGAAKYGAYNWREQKVQAMIYLDSTLRHIMAKIDGEDIDPESGKDHLDGALASLAIYLDAQETGNLIDNRPNPGIAGFLIRKIAGKE